MDIQKIKELIEKRYHGVYPPNGLSKILEKIGQLNDDLREMLEKFLLNGEIVETEVEGYSIKRLKEEHGMNEIGAILTLDWLKREPEKAKESLRRGHDEIVF